MLILQGFSSSSSEPIENLPSVTYQSNQTVSKKIHQRWWWRCKLFRREEINYHFRPSFRRFASFRSSLNEILYEEDEDNEEDAENVNIDDEYDAMKKGQDEGRIPFSFRYKLSFIYHKGSVIEQKCWMMIQFWMWCYDNCVVIAGTTLSWLTRWGCWGSALSSGTTWGMGQRHHL